MQPARVVVGQGKGEVKAGSLIPAASDGEEHYKIVVKARGGGG